jgi:hypothetical protein
MHCWREWCGKSTLVKYYRELAKRLWLNKIDGVDVEISNPKSGRKLE